MSSNYLTADNGVISGTAGIIPQGGSDGTLQIRTTTSGGTPTTAATIDNNQNYTFANPINTPNTFGFKNRIINGAMMIDQRNSGASVTPASSAYTIDRWKLQITQASKITVQQTPSATETGYATRVGAGFTNYLAFTTASAATIGSTDQFVGFQAIEGLNASDLAWGTSNAKSVTLSFWAYSSLTGTFGGSLQNSAATQSYVFSYSIASANTWTQISVTIPGDTSGTWLTTNGVGIYLTFDLGSGSTLRTTAGSWTSGSYNGVTSGVSPVTTSGATFYITGVQLEKGTIATSFDYRPYGTELALCQRYFQWNIRACGFAYGTTGVVVNNYFPVQMRTTPSLTLTTTSPYIEYSPWAAISTVSGCTISNGHMTTIGGDFQVLGTISGLSGNAPINFGGDQVQIVAEL
jgi:hypothetical protein